MWSFLDQIFTAFCDIIDRYLNEAFLTLEIHTSLSTSIFIIILQWL